MSGSLQSVTERLFCLKATSMDDGVYQTYIQDASIQIIEDTMDTHLWLSCGEPFEDEYIRIDIDGYKPPELYDRCAKLIDEELVYGLSQLEGQDITVELTGQHSTHPEAQEIEQSVVINDDITGVMTHIYTQSMYLFKKNPEFEKVQSDVDSALRAYHHGLEAIEHNRPVPVDTVRASETHLVIDVDTTGNQDTLTIEVELPNRRNVLSHPTTEFLDSHCSGVVEDLEHQTVHLTTDSGLGSCEKCPEICIRPNPKHL